MGRYVVIIVMVLLSFSEMTGQTHTAVVADAVTGMPLANASVFDRHGKAIGISNNRGRLPLIGKESYPVTVRYLGYEETSVSEAHGDTIFMQENIPELPEVTVETRQHRVLHMLAYVREYSTLSTYTDTVSLFREKMVDYMLTTDGHTKFKGWSTPRILTCKSYYRFTNAQGLDSVSDVSNQHFTWSDWIGVVPVSKMPSALRGLECGTDTLHGRYSPSEIWTKRDDKVIVDVNVMVDTAGRRWVPGLSAFFRKNVDFENLRIRFNYGNVAGDTVCPIDLTGYAFTIESNGRGYEMFRFNRVDEPVFVSTYAEVYMLDKEYITVKEAKKWEKLKIDTSAIGIYEPEDAPPLQPSVLALIDRVNSVDREQIRLDVVPDHRMIGRTKVNRNFTFGNRALGMLKTLTGISRYKFNKNFNNRWRKFRKDQVEKNNSKPLKE